MEQGTSVYTTLIDVYWLICGEFLLTKIAQLVMSTIQLLVPCQPWFMFTCYDEFVAERDTNLFLKMYNRDPLFVSVVNKVYKSFYCHLLVLIHEDVIVRILIWYEKTSFNKSWIIIVNNHWIYMWKHYASTVNVI